MSVLVFLTYLAVGIVVSLPLIELGREGRSFFLFCGALALTLGCSAAVLRGLSGSFRQPSHPLALEGRALMLLAAFLAGLVVVMLAELRGQHPRRLFGVVAIIGVAALLTDTFGLHHGPSPIPAAAWLHPLNAVGCAWLAGSIMVAMILGHYYLVMPGASTAPLMRVFKFSLYGLMARFMIVGTAAMMWWHARPPGPLEPAALLTDGVFVAQRILFGLVLPASLGYFTWKTILIRSTQSATGILYVVVFLTLVGEALSVYLSLATGIPI